MLGRLSPSALALALGTPAYGMSAIPVPAPGAGPVPSALTPHAPMRAIPAPGAPAPGAAPDSVRPPASREGAPAPAAASPAAPRDTLDVPDGPDEPARPDSAAPGAAPNTAAPNVTSPDAAPSAAAPAARVLGRPARGGGRVRLEVSLGDRLLYALQGGDTLLVAPAGVGSGDSLRFGGRAWRFTTPPGRRVVLGKQAAPVWVPPEWHYAELAARKGYTLRHLRAGRAEPLGGGRRLVVRGERVGVAGRDGTFEALPADEEIVFGNTLYVPPLGTANRRIPGQLGAFRLDLGDGFLIHGTPNEGTVGTASSHGCVRLAGDALAWVYANVPVGAAVVIR